ncbi:MAG: DUF2357 domain-containing protein [Thermodesulfobacteriota bacterium]
MPVYVESNKISRASYEAMLNFIAEKYANLVFGLASPLGEGFRKKRAGLDMPYIEYLFLKRYLIDSSPSLDAITSLILANPHHRLEREFQTNSIETIGTVSPAAILGIFNDPNRLASLGAGHNLSLTYLGYAIYNKTGKTFYPAEVVEERKHHTADTNENRFVKFFLQSLQRRLYSLEKALKGKTGGYLNPDIENHLEKIKKKVSLLLSDPIWKDVGLLHFIPAGSQVLQRRDGYRQLFRLFSLLQLITQCDFDEPDFNNILETKDTPTLFEYWSFFIIKDVLEGFRRILSCQTIVSKDPMEQKVYHGIHIKYEGEVSLWFNQTFQGVSGFQSGIEVTDRYASLQSYSHNLRPDIVIEKNGKYLILDAKYKGQRGGFYGEEVEGTILSWKEDDINKMHTYREAIRNVVGAFILYPGEKEAFYRTFNGRAFYEGVGALPLKPEVGACPVHGHLDKVTKVIQDFLEKDW